nr:MAG TPA: hypothetical protein [Caudoviricetes sp.]
MHNQKGANRLPLFFLFPAVSVFGFRRIAQRFKTEKTYKSTYNR